MQQLLWKMYMNALSKLLRDPQKWEIFKRRLWWVHPAEKETGDNRPRDALEMGWTP
jgi:hypothetical protein